MYESYQTSASMVTCKQMFIIFAHSLYKYVILNDSTSDIMSSCMNVSIWNWSLVLMKSKMFVNTITDLSHVIKLSCQIFGGCIMIVNNNVISLINML